MVRAWQFGIFAIVLYAMVNYAFAVNGVRGQASYGLSFSNDRTTRSGTAVVSAVTPNGAAAKAGIKAGDRLTFSPTFDFLVSWDDPAVGDRIAVADNGRAISLKALRAEQSFPVPLFLSFSLTKLAFLVIAALLVIRRGHDAAARALALFLAAFGAGIVTSTQLLPQLWTRFAILALTQVLFMAGAVAFAAFTLFFPEPAKRGARRAMLLALPYVATIGITAAVASIAGNFFVDAVSPLLARVFSMTYLTLYLTILAGAITSLVIAYRSSVGDVRARMRWTTAIFTAGFSGIVALFLAYLFGAGNNQAFQYGALTILVIPLGLAYVILKHRLFDISFVINRAVVYALVSVVVVGAFIMFEWLLSHVVEDNSRTSVVLQLGGALALGLSIRYVHARVDRYVDDLFFRDRHMAEHAMRRFAHEAGLITDADVLVQRTVEVAQRHARLDAAAFYVRRDGTYIALRSTFADVASFDENDEAILEMRAWHEPVHLHDLHSSKLPGDNVFPMLVRGTLTGFLLCGAKLSHEALAPDERDALRVLARDAGIALDSLRVARIEAELALLNADDELPPALRVRLSSLLALEDATQPAGVATRFSQ